MVASQIISPCVSPVVVVMLRRQTGGIEQDRLHRLPVLGKAAAGSSRHCSVCVFLRCFCARSSPRPLRPPVATPPPYFSGGGGVGGIFIELLAGSRRSLNLKKMPRRRHLVELGFESFALAMACRALD